MSDSITERIAAIHQKHHLITDLSSGGDGQPDQICSCRQWRLPARYTIVGMWSAHAAHVAEVIVEQLGLTQEWAAADKSDKGTFYGVIDGSRGSSRENAEHHVYFDRLCVVSRYVTKWEAE